MNVIIMNHNEGRECRRHDSQMSPPWMDQENSTTFQISPNISEDSTLTPNLDVITSTPDLQWFLQSTILSQSETAMGTICPFVPTTMSNCPCLSLCSSPDPSCNRSVGDGAVGHEDYNKHMSSEELDRIRIRRERNREAAARCRDRRRMLIDTLQNETDHLEHEKTQLEEEIATLERERERLELVFEAHTPFCKFKDTNPE